MTEPERLAIASRPSAVRSVTLSVGCKVCGDEQRFYNLLDPDKRHSSKLGEMATYLFDAPDIWSCGCGNATFDLTFAKRGVHDLFRRTLIERDSPATLTFTPLYEKGQLADIYLNYHNLINSTPLEEVVQKFIEENPVIWSFLSPLKIIHKPPILTKRSADFGILTAQKILYLVEIEKPQTQLSTKKGGRSAEVQKGFDQINDWNVTIDTHRLAFLSGLDLKEEEVHDIRYLLVAGLTYKTSREGIMNLHRNLPPSTLFYCFDDLASFLHYLEAQLGTL